MRVLIAVVVSCSTGTAGALTLHEAQQTMFSGNADLKAAQLEQSRKERELDETRAAWWPQVDLSGNYSYTSEVSTIHLELAPLGAIDREIGTHDRTELGIELTYPLFTGLSRLHETRKGRTGVKLQERKLETLRNNLSFALGVLYFRWVLALEQIGMQQVLLDQLGAHRKQTQDLFEAGVVPRSRALEASARLAGARAELLSYQNTADSLRREAMVLLGISDSTIMPDTSIKPFAASETAAILNEDRPELESFALAAEQLRQTGAVVNSRRYPGLFAMAGYRYGNPGLTMGSDEFMGYGLAGLQLKWNLFSGNRTISKSRQLRLQRQILDLERQSSIDRWRAGMDNARAQLQKTREQIEAADSAQVAAREFSRELANAVDAGTATATEYLNALVAETQAGLRSRQARFAERLAVLQLKYAAGEQLVY